MCLFILFLMQGVTHYIDYITHSCNIYDPIAKNSEV